MSHHSSEMPELPRNEEAENALHEKMKALLGKFPDGKMNKQDEGALALSIGIEEGKIVVRFPKPVAWIGFTSTEAAQFAQSLIDCARKISNSPFSIRI